ncbi:RAD50-interacting protein 1-like [Anneissia japonica]|uniref:RAD50-interacting protein 1-like n=1 Tax=Anneissia japonica TaxID=1529436 RepID=UPI0014257DB2|nr:RAD50-interacting protein 1-like [Anneissia japonica]
MESETNVSEFVNSCFGDDIKSLDKAHELLKYAKEEHSSLAFQVSSANQETPSKIQKVLQDASIAKEHVEVLAQQHLQVKEDVVSHLEKCLPLMDTLTSMLKKVKDLEKCMQYMKWLALVNNLSSEIQGALLVNTTPFQFHSAKVQQSITAGAMPSAVNHFVTLVEISKILQNSKCYNLTQFIHSTIFFWFNILKEKLSSEFEDVLTAMGLPIVSKVTSLPPSTAAKEDLQSKLDTLCTQLLKLQLPEELEIELINSESPAGHKTIILPIQLLLKPLKKRFRFHFYGKKQTNNPEKPEFYFTQVLSWIRDHGDFLDTQIQPILNREQIAHISAKIEFCRGLIQAVVAKAEHDIPELIYDDHLLSHFIDELLSFEAELRFNHGYPAWQPNCIHVLTQNDCFQRWLAIERNFALEKIDNLLSDNGAWSCQYRDISDVDDLKVPQCAESFVTLLSVITDRYKTIPYPSNQLQFLGLQLDLLDDFRVRLLQVAKQEARNPLSTVYCAIINSVNYVIRVLEEWSDQLVTLKSTDYESIM